MHQSAQFSSEVLTTALKAPPLKAMSDSDYEAKRQKISVLLGSEEAQRFGAYCADRGFKKSTLIALQSSLQLLKPRSWPGRRHLCSSFLSAYGSLTSTSKALPLPGGVRILSPATLARSKRRSPGLKTAAYRQSRSDPAGSAGYSASSSSLIEANF